MTSSSSCKTAAFYLTFCNNGGTVYLVRFGLPLMVMTSLSLHVIALLIWFLAVDNPARSSYSTGKNETIPMVILSKESAPSRSAPPVATGTPPPPSSRAAVPVASASNTPPPAPRKPISPEAILSPSGAPHLEGGVVFVLDISGSMYEAYAGHNRLTVARQLLDRQIGLLPKGTPFAVTLYGETAQRSGPLVAANDATRDAAVRYLAEDPNLGGGTNLPGGLEIAEELHPDSIVVVTDGDLNIANGKLLSEARRILGHPGPNLSVVGIAPRAKTDDAAILQNLVRAQAGSYQAIGASEGGSEEVR